MAFVIDTIDRGKGYAEYSASITSGRNRESIIAKLGIAVKHSVEDAEIGAEVFCFDINLSIDPEYTPAFTIETSDLCSSVVDVINYVADSYKTEYNRVTFNTTSENEKEQNIFDRVKSYLLCGNWSKRIVGCYDNAGNYSEDNSRIERNFLKSKDNY